MRLCVESRPARACAAWRGQGVGAADDRDLWSLRWPLGSGPRHCEVPRPLAVSTRMGPRPSQPPPSEIPRAHCWGNVTFTVHRDGAQCPPLSPGPRPFLMLLEPELPMAMLPLLLQAPPPEELSQALGSAERPPQSQRGTGQPPSSATRKGLVPAATPRVRPDLGFIQGCF